MKLVVFCCSNCQKLFYKWVCECVEVEEKPHKYAEVTEKKYQSSCPVCRADCSSDEIYVPQEDSDLAVR